MADAVQEAIKSQESEFRRALNTLVPGLLQVSAAPSIRAWAANYVDLKIKANKLSANGSEHQNRVEALVTLEKDFGKGPEENRKFLNALGNFLKDYSASDEIAKQGVALADLTQENESQRNKYSVAYEKHSLFGALQESVEKLVVAKKDKPADKSAPAQKGGKEEPKKDDSKVAAAKKRVESLTAEIDALTKGAKTPADKERFKKLLAERAAARKEADGSEFIGWFVDKIDEFKMGEFNLNPSNIIGGLLGLGAALLGGNIFGSILGDSAMGGFLGTFLKIGLAILLVPLGAKMLGNFFGDSSAPSAQAGGPGRGANAPGVGLQLSLEGLEQRRQEAMRAKNASGDLFLLRPIQGSQAWGLKPIGVNEAVPNDTHLVSYEALERYIRQQGGSDGKTAVTIDINQVISDTRVKNGTPAARQQAANAAASAVVSDMDLVAKILLAKSGSYQVDPTALRVRENGGKLSLDYVADKTTVDQPKAGTWFKIADLEKDHKACRVLQDHCDIALSKQANGVVSYRFVPASGAAR